MGPTYLTCCAFKSMSASPALKCLHTSSNNGDDSSNPSASQVRFNYIRASWARLLCSGLKKQTVDKAAGGRAADPSAGALMAPRTHCPAPEGQSGYNNKIEMCVNNHCEEKACDSTSNMNGLSAGPLMRLAINEHIKTEMVKAGGREPPRDLFLRVVMIGNWIDSNAVLHLRPASISTCI